MGDKTLKDLTSAVYKIAENSPKIQKDVKDIRDAVCGSNGILGIIVTLNDTLENLDKKWTASKLLDMNKGKKDRGGSNKILKSTASIQSLLKRILIKMDRIGGGRIGGTGSRNIGREDSSGKLKQLQGISKAVEIIEKLRNISFKDFLFAKKKMKNISNIIKSFRNMFKYFKNTKEMEGTMSLANSSIALVKKLSKISLLAIPAKIGAKALEKIFLGDGKKRGGILGILRKLTLNKKTITKGVIAAKEVRAACTSLFLTTMLLTGIAVVGVPAMLGALLLKGIIWILTGTFKMLGKATPKILLGSTVLLIMSASVVTFALGLGLMAKATKNFSWKQFGLMMASIGALGATMAILGIPVVAGLVALGSVSLIVMSAALGIFALSLMAWQHIDTKSAMGNIKLAVEGLRETFGLELGNHGGENKTFGQRIGGGLKDFAMSLINFGSSFFMMGSILLAGAALGVLQQGLKNWSNFNATKAIGNVKTAVTELKVLFGLEGKKAENNGSKLKRLGGSILDMGIALMQGGKSLIQLAMITVATGMAGAIRVTLMPWTKFNAKPAVENIKTTITTLKSTFGLEDNNESLSGKLSGLGGSILDMGIALMQGGKTFAKLATITIATGMADVIKLNLKPWESYDGTASVKNLSGTISGLVQVFGLNDKDSENNSELASINSANFNIFDFAMTLIKSGGTFVKMGTITLSTYLAGKILDDLKPWDNYNGTKAVKNLSATINELLKTFGIGNDEKTVNENQSLLKSIWESGKELYNDIKETAKDAKNGLIAVGKVGLLNIITSQLVDVKKSLDTLDHVNTSFDSTINTINSIDVTKTSKAIELFKSFANLNYKPIDKLTAAVDKFSDSCLTLVDAIEKFEPGTFNIDTTSSESTTSKQVDKSVIINNTQDLATAIAQAIKSLPVHVKTDISDVKLVVDGNVGRRLILTLDS